MGKSLILGTGGHDFVNDKGERVEACYLLYVDPEFAVVKSKVTGLDVKRTPMSDDLRILIGGAFPCVGDVQIGSFGLKGKAWVKGITNIGPASSFEFPVPAKSK